MEHHNNKSFKNKYVLYNKKFNNKINLFNVCIEVGY